MCERCHHFAHQGRMCAATMVTLEFCECNDLPVKEEGTDHV